MIEFLPFNAGPLRTLKNHSGTRECKVGSLERVCADQLWENRCPYGKYPVLSLQNFEK